MCYVSWMTECETSKILIVEMHHSLNISKLQRPVIALGTFIAPNASVIGNVLVGSHSSVKPKDRIFRWYLTTNSEAVLITWITDMVWICFEGWSKWYWGGNLYECTGSSRHQYSPWAQIRIQCKCGDWQLLLDWTGINFNLLCRGELRHSGTGHNHFRRLGSYATYFLIRFSSSCSSRFIFSGCVLESQCIVAAGSVLPADTLIPAGQFWAGNPAKYIRDLDDDEKKNFKKVS